VEIRHLRYFVAVAEELNFGKAAVRLHVAQPGLSQQIKSLEGELGVRLFDRNKRRVNLTEAGSLLLAEAYAVLSRFDQCAETMRQARTGVRRAAVRMGMWGEFSRSWGPALVAEVRRRHPELLLAIEAVPSAVAVRAVELGELDLGIVRAVPERSTLDRRLLAREPLGACLPASHRLVRSRKIAPRRLSGEPLMWMPRSASPEFYDRVLGTLAAVGLETESVESAGTTSATFALVAGGYGWCLACEAEVRDALDASALAWVPLSGVDLTAETWAVWSAHEASPLVAQLLEVLGDVVPARAPHGQKRSAAS
jgi:DNA-binding transcriptional LysR family regulator